MTALRVTWTRTALEDRVWLVALVLAVGWCLVVLDPLGPATIDPDASASVLYFQRIVGGQRLEGFVPTTPKPFLTLVYGIAWSLSGDWREVVWQTIGVFGVAVSCAALFVFRMAHRIGGTMAGFAAAALMGSSDLLLEVSRANSLIWALAWWLIAALAITAEPLRPRLAGAALLVAGLCRFETLALSGVAVAAAAIWWWRGRGAARLVPGIGEQADAFDRRSAEVTRAIGRRVAVGVALAVAWIPVVLLHDWLLTGNPLYWLSVPESYTRIYNAGLTSIHPLTYAGTFLGRIAPEWPLLVLAALGVAVLAASRQRLPLAALAAMALAVAGLLFWLAWRATYISNRYYEPIDLALIPAAAVGVGWVAAAVAERLPRLSRPSVARGGDWLLVAAAIAFGVAVLWPALPWDRRATTELTSVRQASANAARLPDVIRGIASNFVTEAIPLPHGKVPPDRPPTSYGLLVPSRDVSRLAVETGLQLDVIGDLYAALLAVGVDGLRAGQWIIHDAAADRPVALFKPFEVDAPTGRVQPAIGPDIEGVWIDTIRP
jgi:hypothetical protein